MGKPTIKQILDALKRQVLVGKSYLTVAKGLLEADPVILQTAPTFFGLTMDGSIELAQMVMARLYDRTKGTVTITTMLFQAACQRENFTRGSRTEIDDAILTCARRIIAIQPVIDVIRRRRNKWLAHLDPETISDPVALAAAAKLTLPDLDRAFKQSEEILLEVSSLYEGVIGELKFIGGHDYKTALDWIRKAKCAFIENYERTFGTGTWTGPRPKDCTRSKFDLL